MNLFFKGIAFLAFFCNQKKQKFRWAQFACGSIVSLCDARTGELSFVNAMNFEAPADAGGSALPDRPAIRRELHRRRDGASGIGGAG
jgi:hypothetical protein